MEGMFYFPNLYKKKIIININFLQDNPICSCSCVKIAVFAFSRGQVT